MIDRFSESFLDELRSAVRISEVVGPHVEWAKGQGAGNVRWACCPLHSESTPSFKVDDQEGYWKCHGACGTGGDHFKFLMELDGIDFPEAVARVAAIGGIALPENAPQGGKPARPPEQPRQAKTQPQPLAAEGKREMVATYDYPDRDGNLLYQVCRFQIRMPDGSFSLTKDGTGTWKTFLQRRPSNIGDGSWIWGLSAGDFMRPGPGKDWSAYDHDRFQNWPNGETRRFPEGVEHTIFNHPAVEIAIAEGKTVMLCYSPDTEVLTPDGWVAFPDLRPGTQVAQYDLSTESVSFTIPTAHQRYRYAGEMVNIRAAWCDLLVTPDHRQPRRNVRFKNGGEFPCAPSIAPASTIRYGHQLPASGVKRTGKQIELTAARLLVAWLGDGVWEPRGEQVSWNLKKERKQERLRAALAVLGIQWTEHQYPSTPGWTSFRVAKADIGRHFEVGPDKRWPWEMLDWSADARGAALDELQYWDGDGQSDISSRFFTGERQSADVVCALAAITGYHANLRIDRRDGKNDSYVVNLSHKTWRQLANTPKRIAYDGEVFCCTVDTGVLVVRRNGKVTISGNCEGEKDADTAVALGFCGTTNSSGSKHWTDAHAANFRDADVVICLDNDAAGDRADKLAKSMKGIARRIRVLNFADHVPGFPEKGDITDWVEKFGGTSERLEKIIAGLPDYRPRPPAGFGARTMNSLAGKPIEYDWLIKGLVERNGVFVLAAEKQAGKSFVVMDMGMKIARGLQYGDRITRKGVVIHIACEDGKGVQMRAEGYRQANGISPDVDIPYIIMDREFTLMSDEVIDKLIAQVKAWEDYYDMPVELIIIDTLSVATEGLNEIDGAEVGKVLARVNRLKDQTGAAICLVHHMNASGGRVRGHTSIEANVSQVFEIRPLMTIPQNRKETPQPVLDGEGRHIRQIVLTKNKNGINNLKWKIVLEVVNLGTDRDGDPITTCICARPARHSNSDAQEDNTKLSNDQKIVFEALTAAQTDEGIDTPHGSLAPPQIKRCVPQAAFVARVRRTITFNAAEDEVEARNKELTAFLKRTTTALINAGYMGRDNDKRIVWATGKSDRPRPPRQMEQERPQEQPGAGMPEEVKQELKSDAVPF